MSANYVYHADGSLEIHMSDGSVMVYAAGNDDGTPGRLISYETPEHDVYSRYDDQNQPGHVDFDGGGSGDYIRHTDGTVSFHALPEGYTVVFADTDGDGEIDDVIRYTTKAGDVYSDYDDQGNPGHVDFHDHTSGDYTYFPDGTVAFHSIEEGYTAVFADRDHDGEADDIVSMTTKGGDVYSDYDDQGNPGHVEFANDTWGDYTYLSDGKVLFTTNADGGYTILLDDLDGDGEVDDIVTQSMHNGDVYSDFDHLGKPHHVEFGDHTP
ncbi:hypothetical protein ABT369_25765 [Dactylosporangium sp. NPDC000244]|uniref:hypothetical protein n=1 Tax=Dactylosporangium sp. NPDC000244 TaxID=3154365 RepID=UPI00331B6A15